MDFLKKIRNSAKIIKKHIVLPEGDDSRTTKAIESIVKEGIAKVTVLANDIDKVKAELQEYGVLDKVTVISPETDERLKSYAEKYYLMRKRKGLTEDQALKDIIQPLYFGAMLLNEGEANGCVAGASHTTSDVLRAAIRVIGLKEGIKTLSSSFLMVTNKPEMGEDRVLLFADCAVNPDPTAEMLVDIAQSTAESFESFLGAKAKVGLLSFSTKGSATSDSVEKVRRAAEIAKEKLPHILIDGELQVDAAIVPEVAELKDKDGLLKGKANVLVFPNLDTANISYKLVQRFADAQAIGPIIQGLRKPMNDLSRGCSVEDIVNTVAVTLVQSEGK